jgi:hypothetical protein
MVSSRFGGASSTATRFYTVLPEGVVQALEETPRVTETRYFWSGNGKRQTAVCDYQEKIKNIFKAAGIKKGPMPFSIVSAILSLWSCCWLVCRSSASRFYWDIKACE